QALAILMRNQSILSVDLLRLLRRNAALLIRGRQHDRLVQLLDAPSVVHELDGEPIEKLGVSRAFAADAEVARRAHQRLFEMLEPDAVDEDAGGEGIVFGSDGSGEFQAAGAFLEGRALFAGNAGEEA